VAIFGPRDTGKSTFLTPLRQELSLDHEPDAPPYEMIRINLKRALSIPAFISCVDDALDSHPSPLFRAAAKKELEIVERQMEIDFKVFKASRKHTRSLPEPAEVLHAQLKALPRMAERLVICFDEFQRLNRCPGDPLAIIGSALLDNADAGNVSLLFTGSIREYLEMVLNNIREPLFNQATKKKLPQISRAQFREFLSFHFEATEHPIHEKALEYLLDLTGAHPKRSQQLAWATWNRRRRGEHGIDEVRAAFEEMIEDQQADFSVIEAMLANGDEAEATEWRTLQLLADGHAGNLSSGKVAEAYGLHARTTARRAVPRLERRGLVELRAGEWRIIDPFLAEWLRRQSPFNA